VSAGTGVGTRAEPAPAGAVSADEAGQEHRLTIAPDASDADLGAALRQVMASCYFPSLW
jgi:hypothetical protein